MITCSGCVNTWSGLTLAHCSGCHLTFSRVSAFDKHRREFRCEPPESQGLVLRSGVWGYPAPKASREALGWTGNGGSYEQV